jgi:hypothetical protein
LKNIASQTTVPFFPVKIFWVVIGVRILTRASIMVLTYDRKKLLPEKRYSRLAGHVFWRVQITTGKNYDPKKKVQSSGRRLKSMFFGRFKLQPEKITTPPKKDTVVWPTVEINLR